MLFTQGRESSAASIAPADQQLQFADSLYAEGDYYRAIGEYQRFRFFHPADRRGRQAEYRIGLSYLLGGKYEAAEPYLARLCDSAAARPAEPACFSLATLAWKAGRYQEAVERYEALLAQPLKGEAAGRIHYRIGWVQLEEGKYREASERFRLAAEPAADDLSDLRRGTAADLALQAKQLSERRWLNPYRAGAASALIPGSGQLLIHRPYEALAAFFVIGLSAFGAVESFQHGQPGFGIFLCALGGSFYFGNIFSAVNLATRHNLKERERQLQRLQQQYPIDIAGQG